VMFLSDNGGLPCSEIQPLNGNKMGTAYEGHMRTPVVVRWPEAIPAGTVCHEFGITTDFFPTFAQWCSGELPELKIDGLNISDLFTSPTTAKSPHDFVPYKMDGWREGPWKVLRAKVNNKVGWQLYNLESDIGETKSLSKEEPDRLAKMLKRKTQWNDQLQAEARPHAKMPDPSPFITVDQVKAKGLPSVSAWMAK
ncbi:MAG: sulfatase-like hydrolase/transferase, partial [Planctomycetes bacterium]|nr:sulfatase-like hydrolase/transferase [Planctomycetota bacterium]